MKPVGPDSFDEATESYRRWLEARITITNEAWSERREALAKCSSFEFLRATFYRWAQWWPAACDQLTDGDHPNLDHAPQVLGVGDLHVENFGTWRDAESRLVWGINDFDEACCLPYTQDLVRLAASARFAVQEQYQAGDGARDARQRALRSTLSAAADRDFRSACRSVLIGYGEAIDRSQGSIGQRPIILAEGEDTAWLRDIMVNKLRTKDGSSEFTKFLESLNDLPNVKGDVPESAWHALQRAMPQDVQAFRVGHRKAGLGSLGRQRFTAVVDDWHGGVLAREAKALAPSAWRWWTEAGKRNASYLYMTIVGLAVRSRDPELSVHEAEQRWVVRRLAPDSGRVKLANLPKDGHLEDDLLRAMGRETANVHIPLGDVSRDFAARQEKDPDWLYHAAGTMADTMLQDFAAAV